MARPESPFWKLHAHMVIPEACNVLQMRHVGKGFLGYTKTRSVWRTAGGNF